MKQTALANHLLINTSSRIYFSKYVYMFIAGLMGPLGFAPFHLPGILILSLAYLFAGILNSSNRKQSLILGFIFGMGYFGLGVSWVIVSIHDYGQMNYFLAGGATLIFIMYLASFPALVGYIFSLIQGTSRHLIFSAFLFSALWCLSEYTRSHFMTGFPWLLIGTSQIDTPIRFLAPIFGIYGLSFFCCLASTILTLAVRTNSFKRNYYLIAFVLILISPMLFKTIQWTTVKNEPISIGAIQANLSMRDKWDETLFWKLLKYYEDATNKLMGKQLIILPESAIPLPASYLNDYLLKLHKKALDSNSSLILGILQPTDESETNYYNAIITLGHSVGSHIKRHLVPFGEYIPTPFVAINRWFNLPEPNIKPGKSEQELVQILNHPIASLICYEIAYPNLLRKQLPQAQWIVSISDNGWFGRSLASYQQLQMSQLLSLITGRFQVVVNNDGLTSVINTKGEIVDGLPPFSEGILESEIFPAEGMTPWVLWNEYPILIFCSILLIFALFLRFSSFRNQ